MSNAQAVNTDVHTPDAYADLELAATTVFGGTSNQVVLKSINKTATIKQATMRQLPIILAFFRDVMAGMDQECLSSLVDMIADHQKSALAAGADPNKVDVAGLSTNDLVHKTFGNVNLITMLLSATLTSLPSLSAAFTDLTEDEFGDLPPEEGMLIVGGIFMANYGFFTQSLPPLLTAFTRSWASKNAPALLGGTKKVMKRK